MDNYVLRRDDTNFARKGLVQFVTRDRYASNEDFGGKYRVYLLCDDYKFGEPYGRINSLDTLLLDYSVSGARDCLSLAYVS